MARRSLLLRSSVAAACFAAVIGAPVGGFGQPEKAAPSASPLEVRAGQAAQFSRIEFRWAGGASAASKRDGQTLTLRFSRNATPDLSNLKVFPPRWLKGIVARSVSGHLEVEITLTDDADAKVGQSDGATYVNLFKAAPAPSPAAAAATPAPAVAAQPVKTVKVEADAAQAQTTFRFPWSETVAAAVFRRGESVWIVFDTPANMDFSAVPHVAPQFSKFQIIKGPSYTAVRIDSPVTVPVSAIGGGSLWTVTLGGPPQPASTGVSVSRDRESEAPALAAAVSGATRAIWIDDTASGDRFVAVTALGPAKGLDSRRRFADLELLPTIQGLAVEPRTPDVTIAVEGDLVRLKRPQGLALSSPSAITDSLAVADGPQAAPLPSMVDFAGWSRLGPEGFFKRYDALRNAAAEESYSDDPANPAKPAQVNARMALARFLVGSDLEFEGIGVLNLLGTTHPQMLSDPEFRGLRGAAKVMAGRYDEASLDLASPTLSGDPSAALWRGYIAAKGGRWADARKAFAAGYSVLGQIAPDWKARFSRADAEAAINLADYRTANTQLTLAAAAGASDDENMATSLMKARLFEAQGDVDHALDIYDVVANSPRGELSASATLRATKLRLAQAKITPVQAADTFDGLRFRWRGDAIEIETIRALGQLDVGLGRYREALEALRSASLRDSDLPEAVGLQNDISTLFHSLFIDGKADGLPPIEALALFTDFKDKTPVGAEGDDMVLRISRRLVDVDLLSEAEVNLDWQAFQRQDGVARAQVATRLAEVYLMDRKPEQALDAINKSRTTVLPNALNSERRLVTARALMNLTRYDDAQEMILQEKTPDADDLRAEIAWGQHDWTKAGAGYEKRLGDRWKNAAPLSADEETRLLRAAISFSLGDDGVSLARLRDRFSKYLDGAHSPDSLRVALAGIDAAHLTPGDLNRVMTDGDTFTAWVNRMKQKFREQTASAAGSPAVPAARPAGSPATSRAG